MKILWADGFSSYGLGRDGFLRLNNGSYDSRNASTNSYQTRSIVHHNSDLDPYRLNHVARFRNTSNSTSRDRYTMLTKTVDNVNGRLGMTVNYTAYEPQSGISSTFGFEIHAGGDGITVCHDSFNRYAVLKGKGALYSGKEVLGRTEDNVVTPSVFQHLEVLVDFVEGVVVLRHNNKEVLHLTNLDLTSQETPTPNHWRLQWSRESSSTVDISDLILWTLDPEEDITFPGRVRVAERVPVEVIGENEWLTVGEGETAELVGQPIDDETYLTSNGPADVTFLLDEGESLDQVYGVSTTLVGLSAGSGPGTVKATLMREDDTVVHEGVHELATNSINYSHTDPDAVEGDITLLKMRLSRMPQEST